MTIALAHYIRFRRKIGLQADYIEGFNYQNYFISQMRVLDEIEYSFAPFIFGGTISTNGSDASQSSLVMTPDKLTVPLAMQASLDRWLVEVKTVAIIVASPGSENQIPGMVDLAPEFFQEAAVVSNQLWKCGAALKQDSEDQATITIPLLNALDATRRTVPGRVLTESMVGSVPSTGAISGA